MGPAQAAPKEHSRLCLPWAGSPAWGVSGTSQLDSRADFALCTDLRVADSCARREASPPLEKQYAPPSSFTPTCCFISPETGRGQWVRLCQPSSCWQHSWLHCCFPRSEGVWSIPASAVTFCRAAGMGTHEHSLHCRLAAARVRG